MDDVPLFRASKRRKYARPKNEESENAVSEHGDDSHGPSGVDSQDVDVSAVLKMRKANKARQTGVSFTNIPSRIDQNAEVKAWIKAAPDEEDDKLQDIGSRFVKSTGQVVDVDKHMYVF